VFDFDNTIGDFKQCVYILNHTNIECDEILDKLNECFRPNIFTMFEHILKNKLNNRIKNVILYSNNNNEKFVNIVINYIHKKLNSILFDTIITISHPKRICSEKNINDLIVCSDGLIDENSHICFIDDKKYIKMKKSKQVFYVLCEKYKYTLKNNIINNRLNIKLHTPYEIDEYQLSYTNYINLSEQLFHKINYFVYEYI
jgi:hypothetical protein